MIWYHVSNGGSLGKKVGIFALTDAQHHTRVSGAVCPGQHTTTRTEKKAYGSEGKRETPLVSDDNYLCEATQKLLKC